MKNKKYYTETTCHFVKDGEVHSVSLKQFLNEFVKDETTTPHGVAERLHIRYNYKFETAFDEDEEPIKDNETYLTEQYICNSNTDVIPPTYEVWTWGFGGNNPKILKSFDDINDAEVFILELKEEVWKNSSRNYNFDFFGDLEDCLEFLNKLD